MSLAYDRQKLDIIRKVCCCYELSCDVHLFQKQVTKVLPARNMSERHKRCQYMNCCWRATGSVCAHFTRTIVSTVGCLGRLLRRLTRRTQREYVRDDRAGVELVSVQQTSRPSSVCVGPYPAHFPESAVVGDGPREVQPFHRSWYPRYPTLLAISKALDELENTQKAAEKEKEHDRI